MTLTWPTRDPCTPPYWPSGVMLALHPSNTAAQETHKSSTSFTFQPVPACNTQGPAMSEEGSLLGLEAASASSGPSRQHDQ